MSHAKLSGNSWQQWRADRTEAEEAAGKEAAAVETTATVLAVNTGAEGGEATTAAGVKETTTGAVGAEEAATQRSSITGWESVEAAPRYPAVPNLIEKNSDFVAAPQRIHTPFL